jgi:hypothetical protein
MLTLEIPEKNIKLQMPESLAECTQKQYVDVCFFLLNYQSQIIDFEQLKVMCVYKLLGLKYTKKSRLADEDKLHMQTNIILIGKYIENYFVKDQEDRLTIKLDFLHNPIPSVKYKFRTYYGPTDFFQNISWGEYCEGLEYFIKFLNPQEKSKADLARLQEERSNFWGEDAEMDAQIESLSRQIYFENQKKSRYLRELFACFYRRRDKGKPKIDNPQFDCRLPFDKLKIFEQSEKFVRIDTGVLYGFFLFFLSFQSYLDKAQITVGGNTLDLSLLFERQPDEQIETAEKIPGIGMLSLTYTMAETGVFGDVEKVNTMPFWDVILRLYDIRKRDLEEKERLKKISK